MHLYYGGYGKYMYYTVAKNEDEAIKNIENNYNMKSLPVKVELINDIDGYEIKPVKKAVK